MKQVLNAFVGAALAAAAGSTAAETVVIVSARNPATRMFSEQAAQSFLGKSTMFTPNDQADGSAIRNDFYRKVTDKDAAQVKAIWSKLVFTGKAQAPKEYKSNAEVKKAVADDPKEIGYIDKSAVDDTVKVILTLQQRSEKPFPANTALAQPVAREAHTISCLLFG